ncbi:MAG TPA: hypothetical protein VGS22_01325 [Thermoanaerobaculia bacterium]|jgi:hypothetical protein|nr:hypothetical protein [Thermoanaerobaculia bacterium]
MRKRSEIDRCVRAYREGIDAYAALEKNMRAAESATAEVPVRVASVRDARAHLAEAFPILSRLGEALAFLPALAILLTEERRIYETFRRQAKDKGVECRYDEDEDGEDWAEVDAY